MTDIPVRNSPPQLVRAVTTEWIKAHLERMDHTDPLAPNVDKAQRDSSK